MWILRYAINHPYFTAVGLVALAITFIQLAFVNNYINPNNIYILNPAQMQLQLAFSAERGFDIVQSWGPGARERYLQVIAIDVIWPFCYGPFFAMLIYRLGGGTFWSMVPIMEASTNLVETSLEIYWMLYATPENPHAVLFFTHSVVASIKWFVCIPTYFIHSGMLLWKKRHDRPLNPKTGLPYQFSWK
jgi:hypothetical protein